ncbi:MAG: PDZ domain-containing protein [Oscillibacter sp.]|uniref:S1C family serine protease n=1 Tax=Oscillibacter sp. TaxID=1945593 RepID=UPI00216FC21C|nr:trypsin-like peptidase domain-containing protein [Oscillibacter sp.]MCI9114931.1 PDZ domain-containing protein [Oscillibacter sp.]MCI9299424.1 PDZ domain-containing protein [Oscillibacter sp.]MCI9461121.1 PDZ domain-containing protein [Oscillibacter sp.]
MGEREQAGRLPGEIVEAYRAPLPGGERDPREVVASYRQPDPREVVEIYSRPVPAGVRKPPAASRTRRRGVLRGRRAGLYKFLICAAVLVGLAAAGKAVDLIYRDQPRPGEEIYERSAEITIPSWPVDQGAGLSVSRTQGDPLTAQEVYRRLNPAVVTVQCLSGEGVSVGTGVIFSEDGYILTNHHVVRGGSECYVTLDSGYSMDVCFVAGDEDSDLAVLKVPPGELMTVGALPFASFGDSEQLVVGDPVYAIGAPRRLRGTLTNGIISAIDRDIEVEGRTMTLLQTNAALNSGNSGGPLISERGQVVGINVAKYMSDWNRDSVEGLGFAIPSAYLERIVNDLLKWGEVLPEPRLGIWVQAGEPGLFVQSVDPDTAAEAAGVRAGDYIVAAQGQEMHTNQDLFRVRRTLYVGDKLTLTLLRDGETLEVTLELDEAVE